MISVKCTSRDSRSRMAMAMPREIELLDLEKYDTTKGARNASRKFQKKKNASKRGAVDNEVRVP